MFVYFNVSYDFKESVTYLKLASYLVARFIDSGQGVAQLKSGYQKEHL